MRGLVRIAGAVITVAALVVSGAAASPAMGSSEVRARIWLTTVDRSQLMREQAPVAFRRGSSALPTIVVDPEWTYQRVDGFGASITDSSAEVLYRLSPAVREDTLRRLFDPEHGIGVSFLRQPVGSSDFTAEASHYTYDDVPAGETDFALRRFSIAHDEARILPLLRRARQLNPRLTVMATPWSPPAG